MFSSLGTALAIGWPTQMKWAISALPVFRRVTFVDRSSLLPYELFAGHFVLGCIHFDSPTRSHPRDFLDKPIAQGGLALSRYTASLALLW